LTEQGVEQGRDLDDKQIVSTLTLMRAAESKQQFEDLFERVHPSPQPRLPLFVEVSTDDD